MPRSILTSVAVVTTDAPARYAKQLLSHVGRKATVEQVDDEQDGGRLVFSYGTGTLRTREGRLVMEAAAADAESLAHVEDVLGRHLERFGARHRLTVTWERGAGHDG